MTEWIAPCLQILDRGQALVMVTIAAVKGSSPREPGATMLVTQTQTLQSIGGGNLEYQCIDIARKLLAQNDSERLHQRFSLAAGLGQCCAGVVTVLFEKITPQSQWPRVLQSMSVNDQAVMQVVALDAAVGLPRLLVSASQVFPASQAIQQPELIAAARARLNANSPTEVAAVQLAAEGGQRTCLFDPLCDHGFTLLLFGGGHVGSALATLLAQQPCRVSWVDTRDGMLPEVSASNIDTICTDVPEAIIADAAPGSYFLVMTHDHRLDEQLAAHILKRNDFAWFGLIGSRSKRARFEHRLGARGIARTVLQKMVCPIGIDGIKSKFPGAIAVSVMAQLLQVYEQQTQHRSLQPKAHRLSG